MIILGIESSCDETSAAVLNGRRVLSNIVATQHDVHEKYGGVVPELASRRHLENIGAVIKAALDEAGLAFKDINAVAATCAPGLLGSLFVGLSAGKAVSHSLGIPFIGVNHLEGHLLAAELEFGEIALPYVGLVVSGGHTSLYLVKKFGDYKLLGATRDDAAGEAFDKVAKLLGLGYPGGPAIDAVSVKGDPNKFKFTRPKFHDGNTFDFSFSGIKTAVLNIYKQQTAHGTANDSFIFDLAASFQNAVVEILVERHIAAAKSVNAKTVVLAGGVAANKLLRERLVAAAKSNGINCFIPSMKFCTDNAAMIAFAGQRRLERGESSPYSLTAVANQEIGV